MKYKTFILILLIAGVAGCASVSVSEDQKKVTRRLEQSEIKLHTDSNTTILFHSALYYPNEISLKSDGYLIGIEKSPTNSISTPNDIHTHALPLAGLIDKKTTREKIVDDKILYISHIIKNDNKAPCAIYNAYEQISLPKVEQFLPICDQKYLGQINTKQVFKNSWNALSNLESSLKKQVATGRYTNILVITMGWNTTQEEAVRNFNSIVTNLKNTLDKRFNPIVIGVTWPSMWENPWLEPLYKLSSFPVKSADADKLGLTWLGVLLQKTLPQSRGNLPVTVIGHSFGTRAASIAACVGPAISEQLGEPIKPVEIASLVNLQGAFLTSALFEKEREESETIIHYGNGCNNVKNIILTSSSKDSAMNIPFWGIYAGDERSYKKICTSDEKVRCVTAKKDGTLEETLTRESKQNITYVNANCLIKENSYLSGGGAHSDIYRKEHSQLLKTLITEFSY